MKNKYIICLVLIIVFITVSSIYVFKNINSNDSTEISKSIQSLNIISQHNEYALVIDDKQSELLDTYSVYKNIETNMYQKQFSLPEGQNIEGRFVCWTDDKIYILGFDPASYSLSNGKVVDRGNLNKIFNNKTGRMDRVIGIHEGFIYYEYSNYDTGGSFYGKMSLNLKDVTIIQKEDIPKELNY